MSPKTKQDMTIAFIIYGFVGWGFMFIITSGLADESALLPKMVLILMAIVNTLNVWNIIVNDKKFRADGVIEPLMLSFKDAKMPMLVFLGSIAYTVLFVFTNYFTATAIMIIVYMLVERVKPKWMIFLITLIYLLFIYYLFVIQLSVRLIR